MPVSSSDRRKKIYLRQCDQFPFSFVCGAMASSAVSSVLYMRDEAGNHSETRTGAYILFGDAASFHEWEFRTRLRFAAVINALKQCLKSVMDCEATLSSRHEKLASTICAKLLVEDHVVSKCGSVMCEKRFFPRLSTNPKNNSSRTVVPEDLRPDKMEKGRKDETVRLATTTLLDTSGSDGPSDSPQRRTSVRHVTGPERLDT